MKGLIYENFFLLRKQIIMALGLLVVCAIVGLKTNPFVFCGMSTMLVSMMPVTVMVYEEESKMLKILITTATSRKDIVYSKYVLTFVLSFVTFLINLGFLSIANKGEFIQNLIVSVLIFFVGIVMIEIMLPLIFKYGVETGRTLLLVIMLLLSAIVTFILSLGLSMTKQLAMIILIGIPTGFILLTIFSIFMSVKVFKNKDIQ